MAPIFTKRAAALALFGGLTLTGSLQAGFWNDLWCKKPQRPACSPACCPCYGYNQTTWRPWDCWYQGSLSPVAGEPIPVPSPTDVGPGAVAPAVPFGHSPVPMAPPLPATPVPQSAPAAPQTPIPQKSAEPRPEPGPQSHVPPAAFPFDGEFAPSDGAATTPSSATAPPTAAIPFREPAVSPTAAEPIPFEIDERSAFPADDQTEAEAAPQPEKQSSRSLFGDDDWSSTPVRIAPRVPAVAPQAAIRSEPTTAATSDPHSLPSPAPSAVVPSAANAVRDDWYVPEQPVVRPLSTAATPAARIRLTAPGLPTRSEQPMAAPVPGSVRVAQHVAEDGRSVRVQQCAVADEEIGHVRAAAPSNPTQGAHAARTEVRPVRWPFFGRAATK
jgi:hypothetical protein